MKSWEIQKFQFPYSSELGKNGSTAFAYIHKTQFPIFFMNWEKLKGSKITKSIFELGKTWKYSQRPTLKNLNFESMDK